MSSAVEGLTDNLAKTSIQDNAGPSQDTVLASAAEGRRLYIGNLAYATTEGELKEFFKDYKVESTSIPVNPRTERPVGYAFVDLESADDAQKAITNLSGKEVLERKVSVQLARKPESGVDAAGNTTGEAKEGEDGRKRGSGRGRTRGRGRGGRSGRGGRAGENGEVTDAQPLTDVTNEANQANAPPTDAKDARPRAPRPPKQRGPPEDGIPSTNKVMVANLPYDLSEDKLKELFAAYEPVSAKIALRPIPRFMVKKLQLRNEPRKGRGFGFVTLASEDQQQKAVAEMNGKDIDGREIAVKVAIDSPGREDGAGETGEHGAEAQAGAEVAPAAA